MRIRINKPPRPIYIPFLPFRVALETAGTPAAFHLLRARDQFQGIILPVANSRDFLDFLASARN
jgi:hypothetical protein